MKQKPKQHPKRVELQNGDSRVYDRVSYESGWLHGYIDGPEGQTNETLPAWRIVEVTDAEEAPEVLA